MRSFYSSGSLQLYQSLPIDRSLEALEYYFLQGLENNAEQVKILNHTDKFKNLNPGYYLRLTKDVFGNIAFVYTVVVDDTGVVLIHDISGQATHSDEHYLTLVKDANYTLKDHSHQMGLPHEIQLRLMKEYFTAQTLTGADDEEQASDDTPSQPLVQTVSSPPIALTRFDARTALVTKKFPRNFLSDHAIQSITVDLILKSEQLCCSVTTATYNLLNKGISKATHGQHPNNPFDLDEGVNDYFDRKDRQLNELERLLATHDFILLQEICFLIISRPDPSYAQKLAALQARFHRILNDNNFAIVMTTRGVDGISQQPLAILYDKNRFTLQSSKGAFEITTPWGCRQFRGFECTFLVEKQALLVVTNIHFPYDMDGFDTQLDTYQAAMEAGGIFNILGGDTNNPQQELRNAIGDKSEASTFYSLPIEGGGTSFSIAHEQGEALKTYDRFFVVAPTNCYLRTIVNRNFSGYFIIDEQGNPCITPSRCTQIFRTRFATRYRPTEDYIGQLLDKITTENKDTVLGRIGIMAKVTWPNPDERQQQLAKIFADYKLSKLDQPSPLPLLSIFSASASASSRTALLDTPTSPSTNNF